MIKATIEIDQEMLCMLSVAANACNTAANYLEKHPDFNKDTTDGAAIRSSVRYYTIANTAILDLVKQVYEKMK